MTRRCGRRWWVMLLSTAVLVGICTVSLAAEEQGAPSPPAPPKRSPRPGDVVRVFTLKHTGAPQMAQLLEVFPATIAVAGGGGLPQPAIAVSGATAVVAAIDETIKRLDVPRSPLRNVALTGYILEALAKADDTTAPVPPGLEAVLAQLNRTFSYEGYRLVDTVFARSREGSELTTTGSDDGTSDQPRLKYSLYAYIPEVTNDLISVNKLQLKIEVLSKTGGTIGQHLIRTDIGLRPGQQVVVGKSGGSDPGNAVILILSGNIVE